MLWLELTILVFAPRALCDGLMKRSQGVARTSPSPRDAAERLHFCITILGYINRSPIRWRFELASKILEPKWEFV